MPSARLIFLATLLFASGLQAGPWPGSEWTHRPSSDAALRRQVESAFEAGAPAVLHGVRAVVLVQDGEILAERYREGFDARSRFLSWSVAKSFAHALAGILVREGRLALDAPLPVPEWQLDPADPRRAITLDNALRMSSGLEFAEDYEDLFDSDAIRMLFGDGARDMGRYAAEKPLQYPPGTYWHYSSGTTNLVSRVIRDAVGGTEEAYRGFIDRELLGPLGIDEAVFEFDGAGTLVASSLIFMSARDYARFGLLYLRDGIWDGRRILPEGWVRHATTPTPGSRGRYGAQWWLSFTAPERALHATVQFPADSFMARGHQEQAIIVVPSRQLVLVCLGLVNDADISVLQDYLARIVELAPAPLRQDDPR